MKSLNKVFMIIDLLKDNKGMKLQDINNALDLTKSTTHRLLAELVKGKYVYKDNNNSYCLGNKFLEISNIILSSQDIRDIAKDEIDKLNEITKDTIHLAVLLNEQVTYIDKRESKHAISMSSQVGRIAPIYCTGIGKALLAFQSEKTINSFLDNTTFYKYTNNTITNKEMIIKESDKIRKLGYALDLEEHENKIGCIAAPIFESRNKVTASISITAILYGIKLEELLKFKDLLLGSCKKISKKLGYQESK